MNRSILVASLFITALLACGAPPTESEKTEASRDALGAGCGPVHYTGEGVSEKQTVAYELADEDARRICRTTPTFCAVDCEAAPITNGQCTSSAVQADDGSIAVTWSCEVTIAASSPPRKCEVFVRCAPGYVSVDTDSDGCNDTCQPIR